jgi:hypothetical protein
MNNKKKKYVGSFIDEIDAAILYDKVAVLTHGLKVRIVLLFLKLYRLKQTSVILKVN